MSTLLSTLQGEMGPRVPVDQSSLMDVDPNLAGPLMGQKRRDFRVSAVEVEPGGFVGGQGDGDSAHGTGTRKTATSNATLVPAPGAASTVKVTAVTVLLTERTRLAPAAAAPVTVIGVMTT